MADERAQKALAELIMRDIEQLKEKAQRHGVTAYLEKPVQRERPNERFLLNTLRSVQQANKRAEEEEMWSRRRDKKQRLQQSDRSHGTSATKHHLSNLSQHRSRLKRRHDSPSSNEESHRGHHVERGLRSQQGRSWEGASRSDQDAPSSNSSSAPSSGDSEHSGSLRRGEPQGNSGVPAEGAHHVQQGGFQQDAPDSDQDLAQLFKGKQTRGRGAVGSRMDEEGPFMPPPHEGAELCNEDVAIYRRQAVGPAKPDWLQSGAHAEAAVGDSGRSAAHRDEDKGAQEGREQRRRKKRDEGKRKRKKEKKERKEKRHKHKSRRKRRSSSSGRE